ncbi:MAG: DUF1641 domain-containing protein [Caldilineaceae bacterium]|nr:DUF1641 domain-containing protein [Caldilineaceae bacterium]
MTIATLETIHPPIPEGDRLSAIDRKLDLLTQGVLALGEQVQMLSEKAYEDRRRQQEWDELKRDLTPVVNDLYAVTVEQLEEIQSYVQLEDVLHLLKRLARNTRTFNELLDQMESMRDLVSDVAPLTKEMVDEVVLRLDELEQKGYFGFMRQSVYIADQIVTSFSEEDVRQLGDNVVLILNTVKALTQPEMMNLINSLTAGFHEVEEQADELPISFIGLANQMRDPDVRRGLAVTMAMLKKVSQQQHALNGAIRSIN